MTARLFVLGLLGRGPMHGYEIRRVLDESRASTWSGVLPGSIYHALKVLDREGLIRVASTEAQGDRKRVVYAITEAGRAELASLVDQAWGHAPEPFPTRLYAALTFADVLPLEQLQRRIAEAIVAVDREIAEWTDALAAKGPHLPVPARLAFANARRHLELDRELLLALAAELADPAG